MTRHEDHVIKVRTRLNATTKFVPTRAVKNGRSPFTAFAVKMAELAKTEGMWAWKQKDLSKGGAPKDLATALKKFAEGKQGMSTTRLNLIERTCLHYEMEAERERIARVSEASGVPFTGGLVLVPGGVGGDHDHRQLPEPEKPVQAVSEDPEIAALYSIKDALDSLEDTAARRRVLAWAGDKFLA